MEDKLYEQTYADMCNKCEHAKKCHENCTECDAFYDYAVSIVIDNVTENITEEQRKRLIHIGTNPLFDESDFVSALWACSTKGMEEVSAEVRRLWG